MAILLADVNLDGHAEVLDARLGTETWREVRDHLGLAILRFQQAGLPHEAKDDVDWRHCQKHGYYLITANRNSKSDDSLETTIRRENTADSLPVFTLGDANAIYRGTAYLDNVVESLLEYLLDADNIRGTGRLFLPREPVAGRD